MKYFVTLRQEKYTSIFNSGIKEGTVSEFLLWCATEEWFQLDTETLMIEDSPDAIEERKLVLLQLGSKDKKTQWIFEWTAFESTTWHMLVKNLLENNNKQFIMHNARFDYVVIKQHLNIRVENLHDTFLMSKILNTGFDLQRGYHSLKGCLNRFFDVDIDKEAQTSFTLEVISFKQFMYAADDVILLYDLFIKLKDLLESWNLWYLYNNVEREVVKVYADMELSPMRFDSIYWDKLVTELVEEDIKTELALNNLVLKDDKLIKYLKLSHLILNKTKLIQDKSEIIGNWGSNVDRKLFLIKLIPALKNAIKFTKPELKKFKDNLSINDTRFLNLYLTRKYDVLNRFLILYHKQWLLDNNLYVEEGTININWASPVQKLYIFQFYYPKLQKTDAKALGKITTNVLINEYKKYSKVHKYLTTYGEGFKLRYVRKNSTIAASKFNQLLNTGRIAAGILLQMPGTARFRNGFLPPEGNVFVDSDYASAELAIMADLAGEESLLNVIRTGQDAHMHVAQKLFPIEWAAAALSSCNQIHDGKKCDCPEHNQMRKKGKAFNFGIPFGMTFVGLADRLDATRSEAKAKMNDYFTSFPALKTFFDAAEQFGTSNNHIVGAQPTGRIRFFHPPSNDGELQAIAREAKNFKIQECNASMLKIALIKLRKFIIENDYPAQLHLPVHDEILSSCRKDKADEWAQIQAKVMEDAADLFIETGLLKVDTDILERWTK